MTEGPLHLPTSREVSRKLHEGFEGVSKDLCLQFFGSNKNSSNHNATHLQN